MKMLLGYNIANPKSECLGDFNSSDWEKNTGKKKSHSAFKKLTV